MNEKIFIQWFIGFCDAEGNFAFTIYIKDNKKRVNFRFSITQENSEINFLDELIKIKIFDCGQVYVGEKGRGSYYVTNKKRT